MVRRILIALFTVIVAVGAWWMFGKGRAQTDKVAPASIAADDEARIAELQQQIAELQRQMWTLSAKANAAPRPAGEASAAPPAAQAMEDPRRPASDPNISPDKAKEAVANKFTQLSDALAKEPRDPAWAERAEKELGSVIRQIEGSGIKGMTVLSSECKSSMCRIEVGYDSPQSQAQISDRIRSPFFAGGEVLRFEENGQLRSTAYYYRQGYSRPL